ncbi:MAG: hypothetical protein JRL30_14420 [Deltaproteobacteria bacterium]|nr:hypothetical protein [Deltaproteobacteria bacterium]
MKETRRHSREELPADRFEILYRRHFQGALVRSVASVSMWIFALAAYLANIIKMNQFTGITLSVMYLILINPPTLLLLKRITHARLYVYASLLVNFLEILGYTAVIYFLGGIEAAYLTPIYSALIAYVGVVAPPNVLRVIAFMSSAAFTLMVAGEYFGFLPHQCVIPSFVAPWPNQILILAVVIGLLFVVAYTSSFTAGILKKNRDKLNDQNVELMKKTASLRVANDRLGAEITERKRAEEALKELLSSLQKAMEEIKTLRGFVPICANCKKIRDDKGYWEQVETYVSKHTEAQFSHSICPECMRKLYPEFCEDEKTDSE